MPRMLIKKIDEEFQVEFRYRTDFADVFADLLGEGFYVNFIFSPILTCHTKETGSSYTVPRSGWRFVVVRGKELPLGQCDILLTSDLMLYGGGSNESRPRPSCRFPTLFPCPFRIHHRVESNDSVPRNTDVFDKKWNDLMDVSGGLFQISTRLNMEEGDFADNEPTHM